MLKLKLQYFGHLMQRTDSLEKTLILGKIEGWRRGWQRMRWLDGITNSMDMSLSTPPGVGDGQGSLECCSPWDHKESDTTEWLNWTELKLLSYIWTFIYKEVLISCSARAEKVGLNCESTRVSCKDKLSTKAEQRQGQAITGKNGALTYRMETSEGMLPQVESLQTSPTSEPA